MKTLRIAILVEVLVSLAGTLALVFTSGMWQGGAVRSVTVAVLGHYAWRGKVGCIATLGFLEALTVLICSAVLVPAYVSQPSPRMFLMMAVLAGYTVLAVLFLRAALKMTMASWQSKPESKNV